MEPTSTIDKILSATSDIVVHDGVRSLTLEAVALRAGISKGGLLYHFSTKQALLRAFLFHAFEEYEAQIQRRAEELPVGPGRLLQASIEVAFDLSQASGLEYFGAIAGVFAEHPDLLDALGERNQALYRSIQDDSADPVMATVVTLALEGLWMADQMGTGPSQGPERDVLHKTLTDLASARPKGTT
ncbi:MAG: TetR/AcrR family transcriptional regulator [Actinobacteria bacterium]|nr:TetR/AcrR family transcriptional regulator [Actinomycetota bacterium]